MKKKGEMIGITSDTTWVKSVRKYRTDSDWISVVDRFALATFRLLRHEKKTIEWLAQEMHLTIDGLRSNINGTEEVTLKTLIRIQNILKTEILSVRNIDLYLQYKDCKVIIYNEEKPYEMEVANSVDMEMIKVFSLSDSSLQESGSNFKKEMNYEYEEYAL